VLNKQTSRNKLKEDKRRKKGRKKRWRGGRDNSKNERETIVFRGE
jgi:hypothetical protein